jgi:hypothetical protein
MSLLSDLVSGCSQRWDEMKTLGDGISFCVSCGETVEFVRSLPALLKAASVGQCVAVPDHEPILPIDVPYDGIMGIIVPGVRGVVRRDE